MFYGNADDFREYHENRGRVVPATWDDSYIDSALLVASEWLDAAYASLWVGFPVGGFTQERQWPRIDAVTNTFPPYIFAEDEIPHRVEMATYEAAFRQATAVGSLQVDFTPSKYKTVRVEGAISVEYNMGITQWSDVQTTIPVIESLMTPLINPSASFSGLSGPVARV